MGTPNYLHPIIMFRWVVSVLITTIGENCNFTVHYCVFWETELEKSSSDNSAESYFFLDFWPNMSDFIGDSRRFVAIVNLS